jgi:hypothetical protein
MPTVEVVEPERSMKKKPTIMITKIISMSTSHAMSIKKENVTAKKLKHPLIKKTRRLLRKKLKKQTRNNQ